jgi:hypothetical protein
MKKLTQSRLSLPVMCGLVAALAVAGISVTPAQTAKPVLIEEDLRVAFIAADVNKDGVIDIDEAIADSILVFARYDANRDGYLTLAELPGHDPARFRRADRDGDGRLSMGEVAADRVWEFFEVDTGRKGYVTMEQIQVYVSKTRSARN